MNLPSDLLASLDLQSLDKESLQEIIKLLKESDEKGSVLTF